MHMYLGMCILLHNTYTMIIVMLYINQPAEVKTCFLDILNNIRIKYLESRHPEKKVLQN